ncbi:protein phosphatase 1 regulatory subunit 12B-like isoform X21 [Rhynchophorus ferrugineus]|uniref:protein phosphatase 1 regulatory subunit 12B-like isoform X21 n=1 Tax=Rhynchophorus ferrugineus TaxID=354439 RepID=UPI003FCE907F
MSLETRSSSALFKRAEQLKRWEESDTNREPVSPKQKSRRVKFSSGCVFLAACSAGDKEEVLKLLDKGADINTANVDGLTALHQACIDDNLDMVEFLVEHGADVNRGDNEGWTPLHATSSCGFVYIAKFLIEKGANVAAVNNDGELALDITESQKMEDLLREEIRKRGIDCNAARNDEENLMLRDAKEWLATKSSSVNASHSKTGATPLHVAAAKGYIDVMKILLQCSADVDAQDADGWTPLHAAAHWAQGEASRLLVENLADMDAKNYVGQTPFDLADSEMYHLLDDLRKEQNKEEVNKRKAKKRAEEEVNTIDTESQAQIKKVKVEITGANEETKNSDIEMEVSSESESDSDSETESSEESETSTDEDEKKNRVNSQTINEKITIKEPEIVKPPPVPPKSIENVEEKMPWRQTTKPKPEPVSPEKSSKDLKLNNASDLNNDTEVTIRRTKSFQNDELANKDERSNDVSTTSTANNALISPPSKTTSPNTSPQAVNNQSAFRRSFVPPVRDEESETQRKAHAKRVRETRRSTQGVTLEEIKSAEQLVKLKNQPSSTTDSFKLEDATKPETPETPPYVRRHNPASTLTQRPTSAPIDTAETTVTIPLRRPKSLEEKEQDKENDVRNAQATLATQAAIQRRRRPKRRSTGVVSFDNMEDMDQEKDPSAGGDTTETTKVNSQESGSERSSRSRISSLADIRNENGEIDYKKLYEDQLVENERLKDKLRKTDEELRDTKQTLEKINVVTSKNSLSELEKRERRAIERKLSEMEEELKQLQKLKAENERLRADNRSLTRVINKLTNAAKQ